MLPVGLTITENNYWQCGILSYTESPSVFNTFFDTALKCDELIQRYISVVVKLGSPHICFDSK